MDSFTATCALPRNVSTDSMMDEGEATDDEYEPALLDQSNGEIETHENIEVTVFNDDQDVGEEVSSHDQSTRTAVSSTVRAQALYWVYTYTQNGRFVWIQHQTCAYEYFERRAKYMVSTCEVRFLPLWCEINLK